MLRDTHLVRNKVMISKIHYHYVCGARQPLYTLPSREDRLNCDPLILQDRTSFGHSVLMRGFSANEIIRMALNTVGSSRRNWATDIEREESM